MSRLRQMLGMGLLTVALLAARPAAAFLEGAEAAYRRGVVLEKQGNDSAALIEFQAALQHYPNYYYAYREIGNCFVRTQQRAKAVQAYDQYLSANPMDAQVRDYNARLKQSLGASSPKVGAAKAASGFFASLELAPIFLSTDDMNALVPDGSTKAGSSAMALSYGLEGGWLHSSGAFIKAGFFTGASKSHNWKESNDLVKASMQSSLTGLYIAPGFRYQLPIPLPLALSGELRIGTATVSGKYLSEVDGGGKSEYAFSTGVTLIQPRLKADYRVMEHLDLGLSLGFNSAELSKIAITDGNLKTQKNEDAKVSYNAPLLSMGVSWAF